MIEGQFKPFQSLQFEPLEKLVVGGVELTFIGSGNSTAQTVTWPGGVTSECIAFLFDHAVNIVGTPTEVIPTDFALVPGASVNNSTSRYTATYKYPLTGSESGSLTGQNGSSSNEKVLLVFKIAGGTIVNFGGMNTVITDTNPVAQSTAASSSAIPALVLGCISSPTSAVAFVTETPSFDSTVSISNTRMTAGYKMYNLSPSDHTIDMNDLGNRNVMNLFTVQFGTRGYSNATYDSHVSAITNKTLYARADTSYALQGGTLTNNEWNNEAVSTPNITGTATIETNIQNSFSGVLANAGGEFAYPGSDLSTILGGSGLSYTMFAVEKRTGTQGSSTGDSRYQNSSVMSDSSGFLTMTFDTSSRRFILQSYNGAYSTTDTGFDFSDGVPYVLAWRVASDGAVRVNFNGTIFTAGAGSQVNPTAFTGAFRMNKYTAGTNYGFEYIVSTDAVSDTDMDNLVNSLKTKWNT